MLANSRPMPEKTLVIRNVHPHWRKRFTPVRVGAGGQSWESLDLMPRSERTVVFFDEKGSMESS